MKDVYLDGSRLVFVLLESLFITESTKNIDTFISRYHFGVKINKELCKLSGSQAYVREVQLGLDNFRSHFFDKQLTDIHIHLVSYPCQPYFHMLCYASLMRCFTNHYAEQMVTVNELKSTGAKINRLQKLCLVVAEVKKEMIAIELMDEKGILDTDEALKSIDKIKSQIESDINIILKRRNKK
jgi:hypothetical protein